MTKVPRYWKPLQRAVALPPSEQLIKDHIKHGDLFGNKRDVNYEPGNTPGTRQRPL